MNRNKVKCGAEHQLMIKIKCQKKREVTYKITKINA